MVARQDGEIGDRSGKKRQRQATGKGESFLGFEAEQGFEFRGGELGDEIALESDLGHTLLVRLGERGYLYVRRGGDLVLTTLDGSSTRVLVER